LLDSLLQETKPLVMTTEKSLVIDFPTPPSLDQISPPAFKNASKGVALFKPRAFLGELVGTFILTVVTKGAVISLAVGVQHGEITPSSAHLPSCLASGLAVMMAILVTGEASGAQTNPAVSLTMWAAGKLHWSDVPAYFSGQFLGAGVGALFILFNFRESLDLLGPELVASYPDLAGDPVHLVFDQFLATFLLLSCVLSVDDQKHTPAGLLVGLSVAGIGLAIGRNAGASMNPALDFMPRLVAAAWDSIEHGELDSNAFTKGGYFWIVPISVPYLGGLTALFVYKYAILRLKPKQDDEDEGAASSGPADLLPGGGQFGVHNLAFLPDIEKSTHFDGTVCHRKTCFY